ncbi:MAG: methyltransferase domain-containing protein [Jatrophihabitantaceae bacterium]
MKRGEPRGGRVPRVGVLVVAYNAATTLTAVLDRLPQSFRAAVDHVLVCDDASHDDTYRIGLAYRELNTLPLTVVRNPSNLGYGGNQKSGYRWAIQHGLDIVVLLHGDGQYAPEVIEDVVEALTDETADAVLGSRMMQPGAARAGGMPLYKFVGNRILTRFQNAMSGLELSEWHSGYRAYRVSALAELPFDTYSDGFDFDTEIILGLHRAGKRIAEVPIPTYYGEEICYVNGLRYARDVSLDVLRFRLRRIGLGDAPRGNGNGTGDEKSIDTCAYEVKDSPHSSHGRLLSWLAKLEASRILDVGCSDGRFGELARGYGHQVFGVDLVKHDGVGDRLDGFVEADLEHGLPPEAGHDYRVIVAADVLEHVVDPERLLADLATRLAVDGTILVSVPNFAHWYPRTRVALGRFDYDQRGLLDRGHVRFFTRRSFERLVRSCGLVIRRRSVVGTPFDVLGRDAGPALARASSAAAALDRLAARSWPTLFGYQFLYELQPSGVRPSIGTRG